MDENILKCSIIKKLSGIQIGIWIVKYVYFMFIARKLEFNFLDAPVSNRLIIIIKQGVSGCLNISAVDEYMISFISF